MPKPAPKPAVARMDIVAATITGIRKQQLKHIFEYTQSVAAKDDDLPDPPDFITIDRDKVQSTVNKLYEVLGKKRDIDKTKAKLAYVTKHYPVNIATYKIQEAILKIEIASARLTMMVPSCVLKRIICGTVSLNRLIMFKYPAPISTLSIIQYTHTLPRLQH